MKKTMNKFDYPTAASHTFKMYRANNDKEHQTEHQREKFKEIVRREKDIERQKVKEEQNRKKKLQQHQQKLKIQAELQDKRRQLEELEKAKQQAIEQEKRSHELAKIKMEQDKKKRAEEEEKTKENHIKAQNRFTEALQKLQLQKDQRAIKERQAQYRRKVVEQNQKIQREKAIKYREQIEEKQKQKPQKRTFNQFKKPLGRTAYSNIDYTKTRLHNPQIIIQNEDQSPITAVESAKEQEQKKKQLSLEKKQKQEEYMKKSYERGQQAMDKIKRKKQYQQYEQQSQEAAIRYNMDRIQAGKRDQFIGIKPATLSQMEANKKIRGEEQFEKMFVKATPQVFDKPATKYEIIQAKMKEKPSEESVNYHFPRNSCSNEALISNGKYSFQSQGIQDLTTVKKDNPIKQVQEEEESVKERESPEMNAVQEYENRRQNRPDQLSYSESEDSIA